MKQYRKEREEYVLESDEAEQLLKDVAEENTKIKKECLLVQQAKAASLVHNLFESKREKYSFNSFNDAIHSFSSMHVHVKHSFSSAIHSQRAFDHIRSIHPRKNIHLHSSTSAFTHFTAIQKFYSIPFPFRSVPYVVEEPLGRKKLASSSKIAFIRCLAPRL